jgi:NADH-quinone oxidoreductase subunit F
VVNNVQTLAAVPWIVTNGPEAYAAIGAPDAPGTVLVQVSGAVTAPGILEVPLGTSLRDVLDLAGGARGTLKALLVGGPTGGFLPSASLDLPLAYGPARGRRRAPRIPFHPRRGCRHGHRGARDAAHALPG